MYNNVTIESLDNFGRGIAHLDNKIIFISDALPEEIVDIKITNSKKSYSEAQVTKYHKLSSKRIPSICPYFSKCGGCNLLYYNYQDTLDYKIAKVQALFLKNKINYQDDITIVKNPHPFNYRNKLTLKIINSKIGFYEENTHNLVAINACLLAQNSINEVIKNYQLLNIVNGTLTIKTNSNNEILLIINSDNANYNIEIAKLKEKIKLIGIVYNNQTIYGNNFYYERLHNKLFKVSYDSFFQVNPYITECLFKLIEENISPQTNLLDLYSGVGTLGIIASSKCQNVYSVEIIKNAVLNGIFNAKINKASNLKFLLGDVSKSLPKLNFTFDTLIIDPPRKGLDKNTLKFIKKRKPNKIIYISCDLLTLIRDLKELETEYKIAKYQILDMFSYTYHLESFCVLKLR